VNIPLEMVERSCRLIHDEYSTKGTTEKGKKISFN